MERSGRGGNEAMHEAVTYKPTIGVGNISQSIDKLCRLFLQDHQDEIGEGWLDEIESVPMPLAMLKPSNGAWPICTVRLQGKHGGSSLRVHVCDLSSHRPSSQTLRDRSPLLSLCPGRFRRAPVPPLLAGIGNVSHLRRNRRRTRPLSPTPKAGNLIWGYAREAGLAAH